MKTGNFLHQHAEDPLSSLGGLERATPSPFFYSRIISKLSNNELTVWEKLGMVISRPGIAFAGICLIILVNVIAVYTTGTNSSADQGDIAVMDEFTPGTTPGFYDLENMKP